MQAYMGAKKGEHRSPKSEFLLDSQAKKAKEAIEYIELKGRYTSKRGRVLIRQE